MSDLTRYRYDVGDETDPDSWGESPTAYLHRKWLESHRYLVPDSTLQAIANAHKLYRELQRIDPVSREALDALALLLDLLDALEGTDE